MLDQEDRNNEKCISQGIPPTPETLSSMGSGIEFTVTHSQPPNLFVIHKNKRTQSLVTAVAAYYVLDGCIYQAPHLQAIFSTRLGRCAAWNLSTEFAVAHLFHIVAVI